MPEPFWQLLGSAGWLTLEVLVEAVVDPGSSAEPSAKALVDCFLVDQSVVADPSVSQVSEGCQS